jgi:hypothetical protein
MLALDRAGHIQLPPVKSTHNPLLRHRRPGVPGFVPHRSKLEIWAGNPAGAPDTGSGVHRPDRAPSLLALHAPVCPATPAFTNCLKTGTLVLIILVL